MEAATVPPRRARGGRKARAAAADGGGAAGGGDPGVADGDRTAPARERILRDMEDLLWPECARGVTLEELSKNGDRTIKNGGNHFNNAHEIVIPVFLAPKKKANTKKDDIWNKRQLVYGIALLGSLGFVLTISASLPKWLIATFTAVWGFGSVGFPVGLYGSHRCELGYSHHMARFIFMAFSLFVIYMMYRSVALQDTKSPSCSPPAAADMTLSSLATQGASEIDVLWTIAFGIIGGLVMVGAHLVMGHGLLDRQGQRS